MNKKLIVSFAVAAVLILTSFRPGGDKWSVFMPEKSKCSVLMPGVPEKKEKVLTTAIGAITMVAYMYQPEQGASDNYLYGVVYSDYPADKIHSDSVALLKDFFDNATSGAVNNVKGKLISQSDISYHGYPGRESHIDFKDGMAVISCRTYLIKNRGYILQVITPTDKQSNKDINKFMESFTLLDK